MRESFVFHFEYIDDVPEELQGQYAMYVINYARLGVEPEFTDWRDKKLWTRTKNRLDAEFERYENKCQNLKQNKNPINKKQSQKEVVKDKITINTENNLSDIEKQTSDTEKKFSVTENELSDTENNLSDTENQISVGVYEYESVYDSDNEYVTDIDSGGCLKESPQKKLVENNLVLEKDKLFHELYKVWCDNNMPLCNASRNNEFYFRSRELKDSLEYLRCYSPTEIYEALDNYIALHNYILSGQSWMKQSNASFVNFAKKITDFLNGNFNLEKYANSKNKTENQEDIFEKYEFLKEACK